MQLPRIAWELPKGVLRSSLFLFLTPERDIESSHDLSDITKQNSEFKNQDSEFQYVNSVATKEDTLPSVATTLAQT